ncbi:MAG: hypothetical protein ACUVXA_08710 [Candidatus Jordarchaeum sp.]|uniref:hypothetical protein n=1 Tax=Candidatus Jordarchaeum sp. TaxID=2823881 RepID=UPI00404A933C
MYNREEIIDKGLEIVENNLASDETILFYDFCVKARIKVTPVTEALAVTEGIPGLLAFTNHNIFFVQKSGLIKSTYEIAVKIPLEQISHLDTSGLLMKSLKITVGTWEEETDHVFLNFKSVKDKEKKIEKIKTELEEIIHKKKEMEKKNLQM